MEFRVENFCGLHACTYCVNRAFKQSQRKLSLIGTKQRKFSAIRYATCSYVCLDTYMYVDFSVTCNATGMVTILTCSQ